MFTVGGSTTAISLTRLATDTVDDLSFYAANDATLNISLDNGTCTGITTAATSANTTAGVLTSGAKIYDAGVDFEGVALSTAAEIHAILIECEESGAGLAMNYSALNGGVENTSSIREGVIFQRWNPAATAPLGTVTFTSAGGRGNVTVTVIAETA
jgi:hypothetical protein